MGSLQRKYRKTLEALVYIANKDERHYWILKTIYFADKEHLTRYGRQLFGDSYRAMKQGPVPSLAYDVVKNVRGDGWYVFENPLPSTALNVPDRYTVVPKREADTKFISESEIICLDYAHDMIKDLNFGELKALSHDEAYRAVEQDDEMSLVSIIKTLDNGEEILDYLKDK